MYTQTLAPCSAQCDEFTAYCWAMFSSPHRDAAAAVRRCSVLLAVLFPRRSCTHLTTHTHTCKHTCTHTHTGTHTHTCRILGRDRSFVCTRATRTRLPAPFTRECCGPATLVPGRSSKADASVRCSAARVVLQTVVCVCCVLELRVQKDSTVFARDPRVIFVSARSIVAIVRVHVNNRTRERGVFVCLECSRVCTNKTDRSDRV